MLHRTQHGVVHALEQARRLFPFPILGIDTDNGSEFINEELLAYCAGEQITFTRGRVGNKNDQAWVELCGYPHNSTYADSGIMPTRPEVLRASSVAG